MSQVFIGCIPNYVTEEMLKEKFEDHGTMEKFFYMPDKVFTDRGWAFITYADETEAAVAIAMMHGQKAWNNTPRELQVKYANEKITELEGTVFDPNWCPIESVTPWEELRTEDQKSYYYNHLTEETVWERPEIMNQRPSVGPPVHPTTQVSGQITGPPGANLFVYGIPTGWQDYDLNMRFKEFGQMIAAKIYVDPTTQMSKGFGFVSYTKLEAATKAIEVMHGIDVGENRFLRVSIKKGEENENPDAVAVVAAKVLQMPKNGPLMPINHGVAGQKAIGLDGALNAISSCYNKF